MLINALLMANDSQRTELNHWIESKDYDPQAKIAAVTKLYDEIGIRKLCEEKVNYYFQQSLSYINKVKVDDSKKVELRHFIDSLMNRQY